MDFDAVLLPQRRARMIQQGYWLDKTILQSLNDAVHQYPDKTALVSIKDDQPERSFTYRELLHTSNKIAMGLRKLGIQKNDIVSCQLPNWWEFSLLYIACRRIGAVLNPLMPIFRERELTFMLKHSESKVFIVPKIFRKFDYEQLAYQLQKNINSLQHVIVIDGNGENNFADVLLNHGLDKDPQILNTLNDIKINADDIAQLIFTSGTTGEPKGVMHTANTLFANIVPYAERLHLNHEDVILMASPMAHQTGFMYGLIMPVILKAKVVLQDIWDVDKAIDIIDKYKITFTMASTPFLNDLSNAASQGDKKFHSLKTFLCAGAPIPGPLVKKARENLGVKVISAWGMSECGAVTMTRPEDDDERSFNTDGLPLPGVEIKIIDQDGKEKGINEPGSLMIRTCSNFGGYLKRPYLNATDHDDWFDTGDLAYQDEQGYIRICGRNKDVIIRGGENIPVAEIESLLYQHPDIAIVALVSYPDERLGERACAVIKLKEHRESIELSEIVDFLKQHKLAVQYIPERLEVWNEIPMTPSGKIQKFKLREMITSNS
ncbi:cyclohexanecarboxylate-CoA ligase [Acinetobacter sp. yr461]|uniref:cyclohexanecarboxylate-CoA ligase n=1 Tax=Acinetobacter sp. yr461 TaxID=1761742 RepID=UPI0008B241AF|nr:cyclohexanecarboxylate-CoA ligase [Acinetobacter sp. yr461]SEO18929.1 cyclohexanecarboxylate-CoA ligase [Acinetobacter sp. yr461]